MTDDCTPAPLWAERPLDGLPFMPNGKRFAVEAARTARSKCQGCNQTIDEGVLRFGQSSESTGKGAFKWKHLGCVTDTQKTNLRDTYWPFGPENFEIVPGWSALSEVDSNTAKAALQPSGAPTTPKLKSPVDKAQVEADKRARDERTARHNTPVEQLDWVALLDGGVLDDESDAFLKRILKHLGLTQTGKKPDLLARLRGARAGAGNDADVLSYSPGEDAKAAKKARRETPVEDLDLKALLADGTMESEAITFIKPILSHLDLKCTGTKDEMIDRLKKYYNAEGGEGGF